MYKIIFFLIVLVSCNTPIEETDNFEFFLQLDDYTTLIIHDKVLDEYYTYHNYKDVPIDIYSLKNESSFFTDKLMIYRKYNTSDSCLIIAAPEIDRASFLALEHSVYGKDKNYVYDCRNGVIPKADINSFETLDAKTSNATGKDKNNYYFWNQILKDTINFRASSKKHQMTICRKHLLSFGAFLLL